MVIRMNTIKILVAEDREDIADLLKLYLEKENFIVHVVNDGLSALDYMKKEDVDLCIFDIMMPKMNGFLLIKEVRLFSKVPIIVLTAKINEEDRILGLDLGADDYITKPFSYLELVSRVKANLRRTYEFDKSTNITKWGELEVNKDSCIVLKNGVDCELTSTEYKILMKLLSTPERVYTKRQLYEEIYGEAILGDEKTIAVHMSRLRDKIEDDDTFKYIKTIRGLGYKLAKQ